jgi:hypothetical protein
VWHILQVSHSILIVVRKVSCQYLCLVSSTHQRMMYASTSPHIFQSADIAGKIFDLVVAEDLTDSWLSGQIESSKTRP